MVGQNGFKSTLFGGCIFLIVLSSMWVLSMGEVIDQLQNQIYEKGLAKINSWSKAETINREIWAVTMGSSVTQSSYYQCTGTTPCDHVHYWLDYHKRVSHQPQAWAPSAKKLGEWIQVNSDIARFWKALIIQGRGDGDFWVTKVKISYSMNGLYWDYVEDGKEFEANIDRNSKVRINFAVPIYARVIRINPVAWKNYPQLRFDVICYDMN